MTRNRFVPRPTFVPKGEPFRSAEEAWFWAVLGAQCLMEGARGRANMAEVQRPCEPRDVLTVLSRLRKHRQLSAAEHRTLLHYGAAQRPPDRRIPEEVDADRLWDRALERLHVALEAKGFVQARSNPLHENIS